MEKFYKLLPGASTRCRDACQTSERYDYYNTQSRDFETSRDLAIRRLTAWRIEALESTSINSLRPSDAYMRQ